MLRRRGQAEGRGNQTRVKDLGSASMGACCNYELITMKEP